jgi:hypothetical protein
MSRQRPPKVIHDAKLPPSFVSARWRRGYNPDNIFASTKIAAQCKKETHKNTNVKKRPSSYPKMSAYKSGEIRK